MYGYVYIARAFKNLKQSGCVAEGELDNDPHIWKKPYTWGICRPDMRKVVQKGDYVFFVLGKESNLHQMIFAYILVDEIITHEEAFHRRSLRRKRMTGKKNTEGNIIVNADGSYNKNDKGRHFSKFEKIKNEYVIANMKCSRVLNPAYIKSKSPDFMNILRTIFGKNGVIPNDIISTKGKWRMSEGQVNQLLKWLN